jgi:hypothetical protein
MIRLAQICIWKGMGALRDYELDFLTDFVCSLPLSIDEPVRNSYPFFIVVICLQRVQTLAALVSPHRISSSRFFQTRLSNPPRIIAFVRYFIPLLSHPAYNAYTNHS